VTTANQAIEVYLKIRSTIEKVNRDAKEKIAPLTKQLDLIESFLKKEIDRTGMDSLKGEFGTAFITTKDFVSIKEKEEFKFFLAETMLLNLQGYIYKTEKGQWQPDGESDLKEHVDKLAGSGAFDLITLSASKTNCKDFMNSNEGIMPPGIVYTTEQAVQIRKSTAKK